jgi:seryl-tRNA synthetase
MSLEIENLQKRRNSLYGIMAQKESQKYELEAVLHNAKQMRDGNLVSDVNDQIWQLRTDIDQLKSQIDNIGLKLLSLGAD